MTKPVGWEHQDTYRAAGLSDAEATDARNRGYTPNQAIYLKNLNESVAASQDIAQRSLASQGMYAGQGAMSDRSSFGRLFSALFKLMMWCVVGLLVLVAVLFAIPSTRGPMFGSLGQLTSPYAKTSGYARQSFYEELDPGGKSNLTVAQVYGRLPKNAVYNVMNKNQKKLVAASWQLLAGGRMKQWRQTKEQRVFFRKAIDGYLSGLALQTSDPRVARDLGVWRLVDKSQGDTQSRVSAIAALDLVKSNANPELASEMRANGFFRRAWAPR